MSQPSAKKVSENIPHQASEELYQALFDQAADGIFIADNQGRCIDVNRHGYKMLGYSREELLGLTMEDLVTAEDLANDPIQLNAMRAGTTLLKERHLRCKDGRFLPVEISARMLPDGRFLSIVRDISERRQIEEQLRESNERFRLLAESSLTGIYLIQDNRFRYVNPAMAHIFGYEVAEITDKLGPMDLVYADDRPLVAKNVLRRVEGEEETIHYDFRGLHKDGSIINVDVHGRRIEYSGKTGVIGTLVDITERKRTEEALRTSEEQLHLALDAAQMGLWNWNITTGEVVWSHKCLALYGLPSDTQMSYEQFMQALHPDDRERIDAALRRAVEEHTSYDEQKRAVWPDGSVHWTASRGQVYYDAAGEPIHMTGVSFNISKWKVAEAKHQAHLWFLESMDQVNLAMQGTNDLEQMMRNVLDTVLSIFDCDRAALVYPCDPEAATWQAPMERTKPEWPGVHALGLEIPLDSSVANVYKTILASNDPVGYGRGNEYHLLPTDVSKRFGIASQLVTAVDPKVDKPYMFVIHQCSHPRVWTPEEKRLFKEISRRLADGLTSLLSYRNLRESERRLAEAERIAHVGWWDRDLEANSMTLSDEACRIFGIPLAEQQQHDLAQWQERWQKLIHPDDQPQITQAVEQALQGGPRYDVDYRLVRPSGEVRFVHSQGDVSYDESGQPRHLFGILQDITELRRVEDELRHNRETALQFSEQLTVLQEVTNQLSQVETSDDLCRQAVQLGRSSLGFDRISIWFIEEHLGIMRGSFGTDEHGELRDERNAQVEFKPEGLVWRVFSQKESMAIVEPRPLYDHTVQEVGRGENAVAALWDGDKVIGVISIDNLFTHRPITERQLELLRLYATTLGHLITRKRAEEDRRASEDRFRALVDHAADAFFLHDETGTILDVNRQACESLGYSREELIGMAPFDIDANRDAMIIEQISTQLGAGEVIAFDTSHRRKDGSVFPVEVRTRPIWQGNRRASVSLARDITERRQAQEAITLFRTLIDHTKDAIEVIDPETGRFLDANEQAYHTLGYTREEFLTLGVPDINPKVADRSWQEAMEEFRHTSFAVRESQHRRKNGSIFPVEINLNYIHLDRDYLLAVVRDITERKRTEEALRASEERYRALYRDNPSMFFTLDSEGMIISVNAFGASQLGYTIEELEGQSILGVFFEDDRTAVTNQLQYCVQNPGQTNRREFRKVRKDGSLLWIDEFARAVTAPNGTINILIVCQDITNRKQVEEEQKRLLAQIQEQAKQVQNIIDTVPEGVVLLSQHQFVTLTNPVAREHLTLLAPKFQKGRLTHLGERPLSELLTSPPKGLWHELTSNDLVFEAITRPVENGPENGGWVLVLRDITQERDIQQRVQRQERLAAVGQLAAGIAHDFNNILAVIALYTQLISRTAEMPVRVQERLHTIEQQINRATDLIQQILDFGRQSVLKRQPLDLLPFMEKLVILLERTLPEHIQIELVYTAESYFIQADPSRIQQVMMNLAVNARDAMPEGGHLVIKLDHMQTEKPKPMPVQNLPPGDWVQIEVIDNGNGIPQEALSHIFEPFFTTKEVGEGTGLGLAQVYGIVQQHEGFIDVTTEVGQGTTFLLYFPAFNVSTSATEIIDRVELQWGQRQRILLVEDNLATREALWDSLIQLNYEVLAVTNGREALTTLTTKAIKIDLVLSDVVMPEMGGVALFHAIQEQKMTMPVVLLTGHPLSKEMEDLKALGLAGWLPKPPDLVNLSYLLAKVLTGTQ